VTLFFCAERIYSYLLTSVRTPSALTKGADRRRKEIMSRPKTLSQGQSQAEIEFLARPAKELILPATSTDDCHQITGKLLFSPDGTGVWTCSTNNRNAHHSAVWHTHFAVKDNHGTALFGVGPFHGPRMMPGRAHDLHTWEARFEFPVAYFTEIKSAIQKSGCRLEIFCGFGRSESDTSQPERSAVSWRKSGRTQDAIWPATFSALALL
jgi:hypothetical protein